jgi:transposase InsO family protein
VARTGMTRPCWRASPRPYLREAGGEIPPAYSPLYPMARGFVYLAAVADWFSRRVLAWRLSITMEVEFCLEAVEEALTRYG